MTEHRSDDGRYSPEYTDEEILAAVRAHEPAATSEVADEVGLTRQGADRRLRQLRDAGRVNSKKIAASLVWFAPTTSGRERAESTGESTGDQSPPATGGGDTSTERDALAAVVGEVADTEGWDEDHRLDDRKDAARAVLEYAREHGTVSKQEAKEELHPEHSVEGQDPRTWYRKNIRPVLNEAAEYDSAAKGYRLVEDTDQDG